MDSTQNSSPAPPSAGAAALAGKCPRCRQGRIFKFGAYNLPRFQQMYENCPSCGLRYELEPGFFWGSMYITYALTVAIFIVEIVASTTVFGFPQVFDYSVPLMVAFLAVLALAYPLVLRYSRIAMLYWFGGIRFDPYLYKGGKYLNDTAAAPRKSLSNLPEQEST